MVNHEVRAEGRNSVARVAMTNNAGAHLGRTRGSNVDGSKEPGKRETSKILLANACPAYSCTYLAPGGEYPHQQSAAGLERTSGQWRVLLVAQPA